MSPDQSDALGCAVADMLGAAELVDVMQSHLEQNAQEARGVFREYDGYRIYMLTATEARALDHVLNEVISAAEKLQQAHDAVA
ncbi:hypothetical protein [Lichenibacterium ramalinae]|uniref:Uncharacterized protein n=1 Tax=Lichenibacterium ramalinae TaxID=2316527 RepID=A0A4Q2R8L6_9HYPH|nr:hypothetical protein [Lichenibacterium ramalinae]RYB02407.1 hypothetical protein D3272_20990 [Lichenibacterium ramalinae]